MFNVRNKLFTASIPESSMLSQTSSKNNKLQFVREILELSSCRESIIAKLTFLFSPPDKEIYFVTTPLFLIVSESSSLNSIVN